MADVGDFEDLLAALDDDPSKMTLQHGQGLVPRITADHHQNLSQMHTNSSLPVIQDQINFDSLQQHGLQLGHNQHMDTRQLMAGLEHGMGGMPRNDILPSNVIEDAFSSHVEQSDHGAIQSGSSLGSLFLDSVDEILSNEKTPQNVGFAPPNVQSVAAKPQRPKAKKTVQHKSEKMQSHPPAAAEQTMNSSQQLVGGSSNVAMKSDDQSLVRSIPGNAYNPGSRGSTVIGQQQEPFSRTVYRQQATQLSRPQSNTSCESSFYPGSVPQPSPSGDSNLAPRTPHSNNPLTPQSVIQPNTPQSNQMTSQVNRSASATPLVQMQQHGLINEAPFMQMTNSPPPPVIPDDQSHLQYLNTTPSISQPNVNDISIDDSLLEDLPTPVKSMFPDKFSIPDFSSFNVPSSEPTSQASAPQTLWPQRSINQSNTLTIGQTQHLDSFNQPKQVITGGFVPGAQQMFTSVRTSAESTNFQQPAFLVSAGSNQTSFMGYPSDNRSTFSNSSASYTTGASDGLSLTQSQILNNHMEWGKLKPKATVSISKGQPPQSNANQQTSKGVSYSQSAFQALKPNSSGSGTTSNNTVLNMLSSAESGIKQIFSQPPGYEAVSPISDYSPVHKDPPDPSLKENPSSNATVMGAQGQLPTPSITLQKGMSRSREIEEKLKAGPLARRRSASNEQKLSQNVSKKIESGEFNFVDEDEFGFDQNEPTIRLPTKRPESIEISNAKQTVSNEKSRPILASNIQRENYSDPSVFDSVQELAILNQKRQSLMNKLNASRNVKTLPQKPSRATPKVSGPNKTANATQQQTTNKRNSTTTTKPSRPRKPSKSETLKESNVRPSNKMSTNQLPKTQNPKEKSAKSNESSIDMFYQQFLNDGINTAKTGTVDSDKPTISSAPQMPSESAMFSGRTSMNSEDMRSVQQGCPSSTMMPGQMYMGHQISGNGNDMFEILTCRTAPESTNVQVTAKTNLSSSTISTFKLANSERNASMPLPLRSNETDATMHLKASQHQAPSISSTLSGRGNPKDQDLHKPYSNRFQNTIKANTHSSKASYQPVSTTNSNALLQMYINSTSADSQSSFSSDKNTDAMAFEKTQNKAQITPTVSVSTLAPTFSSVSPSPSSATKQSAPSNMDPQLLSSNQTHLDFLQSLLAKQPVEVTSAGISSTTTSTTHVSNSRHAHSIPGVGTGKSSADRFPILPDMSQIQFDYTTTPSLTSTVSVFPTVSQPTQRFPLALSSASSWSVISSATTVGSHLSKMNSSSSSNIVQTMSSLPSAIVDTLSQSSKKPESKSTSHTISHLPDPVSTQHLVGTKRADLTSNCNFPSGHDPLNFGSFVNASYVRGANRFSSPMPPNQAAVQQSLDFLRLTQQRFQKQSADKPVPSVHFSPHVCAASVTTNSTISTTKSSTLPTYQESVSGALSTVYGDLQSQQSDANLLESPYSKHQQELAKVQSSRSTSTHSRAVLTDGASSAASDLRVTNSARKVPVALDFSSKTPATELSLTSTLVKSSVTAPSSVSQSQVLTKTTSSDPSPLTSTTNILKDKTYHGPKKKHILEKYCQQNQQSSAASVPQKLKALHVPKPNEERSGLGKGRKTSVDKATSSQTRNETSTSNLTTQTKSSNKADHKTAQSAISENDASNGTLRNTTRGKVTNSGDSKKSAQQPERKSSKDEQHGSSIFTLFDSLLQEAAESAKGSLKNDQGKKKEKNHGKTTKAAGSDNKQNSKKAKESAKNKEVAISSHVKDASNDSCSSDGSSQKNLVTPVSPISTATTVGTTSIVTSNATNIAGSRTPANFPFKRRHFHTQNKDTISDVPTPCSDASTSKTTSIEPVVTSTPQTSTSPTNLSVTSTIANTNASLNKLATSASGSNIKQSPLKQVDDVTLPVKENAQPTAGGLRLKITAFRSSGGMVIHQSKALGDLMFGDVQSDDSYNSRTKKRKYKKEKKRRQRPSSSDSSDSSLSIVTQSKIIPPAPVISRVFSSGSSSDACQPNVPDTISSFNSSVDSATGSASTVNTQRRKKKIIRTMRQPALKRQLISMASGASGEFEKTKKQKQTVTKKVPNKSVPRYKLKTTRTQASAAGDVTMSFNRAPGKPPLYLNAGANQTLVSGSSQSVPTIQLLPRTTIKTAPKAVASIPAVTSQSAAKLLSGKLSAKTVKAVQAHVVPKSTVAGVRYLLPTTKSVNNVPISPRIIIPNLSSPSFSVGKATVFTVSSSGARVSGTPSIQIQPTPVQTSSSIAFSSVVSPTQPVVVKRIPLSLLPKVTVSPSSPQKTGDSAALTNAVPTLSSVVSFTSKPMQLSSKVVAPKPFFSSTSTALGLKVSANITKSPIASVIAEALEAAASHTQSNSSREQEFQSAFSKLISSPSPLNKYTPPPIPPQYLDLPASSGLNTEQCFECGDVFYFRSSLQHHYDRRSIVVKVRCVQCNQMLVFFNKCEILRHAREHSDHGEVMQFNGANLSPIPLSLCKSRTKEFFLKAAQEKVELRKSSEQKTTGCAMACTECSFVTDGHGTLEDHFQRRNVDLRTCDICKLPLHNQCVFSAHMRMHRHASPHTCPECGQTFDGNKMEFNLHLRIQCFHLSRASCYKCKLCNLTFITDDQLRHHLRLNHVQVFYKCRECPMAFKTTQNIANHQRSAHNLTPEPTNTLKTIYKCPLCDTVFTDSSHSQQLFVLLKHFDSHVNSTRITAYKCYLCTSLFEQKAPLREHLQNEHKISSLNEMAAYAVDVDDGSKPPQTTNVENEARQSLDNKRPSKSTKRPITDQKQKEPAMKPEVKLKRLKLSDKLDSKKTPPNDEKRSKQPFKLRIKGMNGSSSKIRHPSSDDEEEEQSPSPSPKRKLSVIKTAQGKKSYPCPECEKVFQSSHSRSSHIRSIHRGIRALYCCTRCPIGSTKYAKRITLVKHLKKAHSVSSVQKDDVKIVRTHMHYLSPGTKFKASSVEVDKNGVVTPEKQKSASTSHHPEKKLPRKKITGRHPVQARAKRLAAVAGNRMRMKMKRKKRSCSDESEESYGEVDEKMVEEGWSFDEDSEPNQENEDVEEIDPSMFNFPEIYTCIKCDYQHIDRLVFQAHITEHSQSLDAASALTMVQCTECGLSFASSASLDKHLHIKHKIKRRHLLERYDANLRAARENEPLSESNMDLSAGGSSKTNVYRCKVCFHKFDAETELKTHMRTHGLAFVKSKQH